MRDQDIVAAVMLVFVVIGYPIICGLVAHYGIKLSRRK